MTLIPDKGVIMMGCGPCLAFSSLRTQSNTLSYLLIRAILSGVIALKYQL